MMTSLASNAWWRVFDVGSGALNVLHDDDPSFGARPAR